MYGLPACRTQCFVGWCWHLWVVKQQLPRLSCTCALYRCADLPIVRQQRALRRPSLQPES